MIHLDKCKIERMSALIPKRQYDVMKLSEADTHSLLVNAQLNAHYELCVRSIKKCYSNWSDINVSRSDFAIKGHTLQFSPDGRFNMTSEELINMSVLFAILLQPKVFSGELYQFSSVLISYPAIGTPFTQHYHVDSYNQSCLIDLANSSESYSSLLYVLDDIGIEFCERFNKELLLFPQNKPCSINSLGIDLDTVESLCFRSVCGNIKQVFKGDLLFKSLISKLEANKDARGRVLHRGGGCSSRLIFNVCEELPGYGWLKAN